MDLLRIQKSAGPESGFSDSHDLSALPVLSNFACGVALVSMMALAVTNRSL
jgi:hypothetical protein